GAELRSKPLPVVSADRELVVRLLCHLLRASLSAGATAIEVEGVHDDGLGRVDVPDDGQPASGEPFPPFARAPAPGPLVAAAVSRRIVELHGGSIALAQDADGGTVATFTLPADE